MLKQFVFIFSLSYVLLSLLQILGFGYSIEWVPEATLYQKLKVYFVEGWPIKFAISIVLGLLFILKRPEINAHKGE